VRELVPVSERIFVEGLARFTSAGAQHDGVSGCDLGKLLPHRSFELIIRFRLTEKIRSSNASYARSNTASYFAR
jgi:hypothetical protein